MRGLDPVPGGDVLYQPSTNVPNYLRSLSNRRSRWMSTKIPIQLRMTRKMSTKTGG